MGLVIGAGLMAAGVGAFLAMRTANSRIKEEHGSRAYRPTLLPAKLGLAVSALGLVIVGASCVYTQDAGETVVLRNMGGSLAGTTQEAGFHLKAPWQDAVKYDVRNNVVSFIGDSSDDYFGGSAEGPHVTVNDRGGAQADVDIQVNYSLDPSVAEELYRGYGTQEGFVKKVVAVDARAVPREVAGRFDTITILTNRGEFTSAVQEALEERWEPLGIDVEQVTVQQVTYPEAITSKYAEAQAAEIAKAKAENEQETAKVEAQTKVIRAQGEADANEAIARSLTPEVVQQRYIDALVEIGRSGNLVVVPEGSQPIVGADR